MDSLTKVIFVRVFGTILALASAGVCGYVLLTYEAPDRVVNGFACAATGFVFLSGLGLLSLVDFTIKRSPVEEDQDPE